MTVLEHCYVLPLESSILACFTSALNTLLSPGFWSKSGYHPKPFVYEMGNVGFTQCRRSGAIQRPFRFYLSVIKREILATAPRNSLINFTFKCKACRQQFWSTGLDSWVSPVVLRRVRKKSGRAKVSLTPAGTTPPASAHTMAEYHFHEVQQTWML